MKVVLHDNFVRQYLKLRANQKKKFQERRDLFLVDPFNPILNNHPLKGKYISYRSINISGDLRVIYKQLPDMVVFIAIGSHNSLYG